MSSRNQLCTTFICKDAVDKAATAKLRDEERQEGKNNRKQILRRNACTSQAIIRRRNDKKWQITTFSPHVNCGGQLTLSAHQIATIIEKNVKSNRAISAEDIAICIRKVHHDAVLPSERMRNRARTNVIKKLDMHSNDSFSYFIY